MDSTDGLAFRGRADIRFVKRHVLGTRNADIPSLFPAVRKTLCS